MRLVERRTVWILEGRPMKRPKRRATASRSARRPWHPRAYVRRAVALRVDYATADGRGWLGMVRNLSVQGMYIDSALRHVAHEVAPGNLLTVAFVLPSGRPVQLVCICLYKKGLCRETACGNVAIP